MLAAMSGGDDDTVSGATVADRPGAKALAPRPRTVTSEPLPPGEETLSTMNPPTVQAPGPPADGPASAPVVERTRTFLRIGWIVAAGAVIAEHKAS